MIFFYKESKSKKKKNFFFLGGGGGGGRGEGVGGPRVSDFFLLKFYKLVQYAQSPYITVGS